MPRCTLYALRDQHTLRACNGARGTRSYWDPGPNKSRRRVVRKHVRRFLFDMRQKRPAQQRSVPLASLSLRSVPGGL
jgi:hypothetical protein